MQEVAPEGIDETVEARLRNRLAVVGGILLAAWLATLILCLVLAVPGAAGMVRGLALELVLGREAGIPVALDGGASPPWLVAILSATQDIAIAGLVFPLFLYLLHRYHDHPNVLMRKLRELETEAQKHEAFARRWGPLGVFAFMLVPFLVNGPLVGAAVGRVAGIPTRHLILPVVASTAVAAAAWTFFYNRLFAAVGDLHPAVAPVLTLLIVALFLGLALVSQARAARAAKAAK